MAKSPAVQAAMSSTAAPAPAARPGIGGAAVANIQSIASERDVDVVNWGNGEPTDGPPPAMAREGNVLDEPPVKVTPQKGEPDHPDEAKPTGKPETETEDETPVEVPEVKETAAEKRQRALDSLAAERKARTLETELKAERTKREGLERMTLGDILKARGETKEALLEKLLTGNDGLDLPSKLEGTDATLAELAARLASAEAKLKERDEREADRQVQDGVRTVEGALKDTGVPLPLIDGLNKYQAVMEEAYDMWVAQGKEGTALDHLPKAAEKVETRLRKENPRLAALADAAAKAEAKPAAAAAAVTEGRPGISRRVAAAPQKKPAPLPDDTHDRDIAIKKEMGWG